jgi:hypothetical protein
MKSFENTVARFRKCSEMIEELKEYVNTLTAEREHLEGEIIAYLAKHEEAYNVFKRKTSSAGVVGRNLFTVAFSEQLMRRSSADARLDDQRWLKDFIFCGYRDSKLSLLKSKINADYKAGFLDERSMRNMDLTYGLKASLTVRRVPNDAEIAALRSEAEALADSAED